MPCVRGAGKKEQLLSQAAPPAEPLLLCHLLPELLPWALRNQRLLLALQYIHLGNRAALCCSMLQKGKRYTR